MNRSLVGAEQPTLPSPLLGLTKREGVILSYLSRVEKERVSTIARVVDLPRTTVHFLLKKLESRTLVVRRRIGKHYEWALGSPVTPFGELTKNFVHVVQGVENFKEIYHSFASLGNGERLFVFQGTLSAERALAHLSNEFFSSIHTSLKKRRIIIEGVTGESTLALFKKLPTELLESHWGRATIIYTLPDEYTSFDADIFSVRDRLYIFNFEQELAVIIENPAITEAVYSLIALATLTGKRVDLNGYIKEILEQRK